VILALYMQVAVTVLCRKLDVMRSLSITPFLPRLQGRQALSPAYNKGVKLVVATRAVHQSRLTKARS